MRVDDDADTNCEEVSCVPSDVNGDDVSCVSSDEALGTVPVVSSIGVLPAFSGDFATSYTLYKFSDVGRSAPDLLKIKKKESVVLFKFTYFMRFI